MIYHNAPIRMVQIIKDSPYEASMSKYVVTDIWKQFGSFLKSSVLKILSKWNESIGLSKTCTCSLFVVFKTENSPTSHMMRHHTTIIRNNIAQNNSIGKKSQNMQS